MFRYTYGNGENLVVGFHGWSGDHATFEPLARHLPADCRILAFDLPGFGQSAHLDCTDIPAIGRDAASAIADEPAASLTLISSCSGALPLLAAVPHLVRTPRQLILIDAFAFAPWYFRLFLREPLGRRAFHTTFGTEVGRRITNSALATTRPGPSNMTAAFARVDEHNALAWLKACVDTGDFRQFASIRLPTTLAHGQHTFNAVRRSIAMWQSIWPHARVAVLAGASHLGLAEATQQVLQLLLNPPDQHVLAPNPSEGTHGTETR